MEKYVPPRKGTRHVLRLMRDILFLQPRHPGTCLKEGLDYLNRVLRRRAIVFLFSDFLDDGYARALQRTGKRHDLIGVALSDPLEQVVPSVGLLGSADAETGRTLLVDTSHRAPAKCWQGNRRIGSKLCGNWLSHRASISSRSQRTAAIWTPSSASSNSVNAGWDDHELLSPAEPARPGHCSEPVLVETVGPVRLLVKAAKNEGVLAIKFSEMLEVIVELDGGPALEVLPPPAWTRSRLEDQGVDRSHRQKPGPG